MGARHKLNIAYLNGALIVAALVGGLADSWIVFLITAGIGVVLSLAAGEIRFGRRDPRNRRR